MTRCPCVCRSSTSTTCTSRCQSSTLASAPRARRFAIRDGTFAHHDLHTPVPTVRLLVQCVDVWPSFLIPAHLDPVRNNACGYQSISRESSAITRQPLVGLQAPAAVRMTCDVYFGTW